MLSIIVSSYQEEYFIQFSKNIEETIGNDFEYEIIQQWNPGTMGICEAYNRGAEKAQYENLLFIHEDVIFETKNWGNILTDYLKMDHIGCIGLAGANYIPNTPTPWWVIEGYANSHLSHYNKKTNKRYDYTFSRDKNRLLKTKLLDGVFIACRKNVWKKIKFNEDLKGFHGYDINFSIKVTENYQNYITNKISIVHFSHGNLTKEWLQNLIVAYKESNSVNQVTNKDTELFCFNYLADQLRHFGFTMEDKMIYLNQFISYKNLGLKNWLKAKHKIKAIKKYNN
ncbi:glycosyltransferase [Empedobacter sp. GD03797]|uniref:glycosyltransferase n=1 Tax=Empedobacter sp. GD03797 TaxID=2975382 RepID=UPI00244AC97E|nr:glycosyltransferase [Empedobacter sp. GD03797]MDH1881988.1 glycosyltransferase family protein [Empedobacter sp. GD03797]